MKLKLLKTVLVLLICTFSLSTLWAQTPEKMSYQAVIRNSSNQLVTNTQIGMKISVLKGSVTGMPVYVETNTPTTNANGLVSIEIGGGVGFDTINWSSDTYFIKTETAVVAPLTTYTITGVSQLLSVPYALHAKTADNISGGIVETDPVFVASPANGVTNVNITNWNSAFGWGNHASAGYLTGYTETDPIFGASVASGITSIDTMSWNHKFDLPVLSAGSILFSNGSTIIEDNNNLYWDNTNKRFGIGTNTPSVPVELKSNLTNQSLAFVKVVNSNGDSILTVTGNGTAISIDSTSGNFSVWQLSGTGKKYLMNINPSNSFIGYNAGGLNTLGNSNVFIGNSSGASNTTGSANIMIGLDAGRSNTIGFNNIHLGQAAGYTGTNIKNNIFIGDSTGFFTNNTFATKNIFIGYSAGKNTQSYNNVYIGNQAGYTNVSGQNNIAIGDMAGFSNTTSQNIFIGTEAGKNNTTGYFNIIMGRWAGRQITTGSQQTIIGAGTGASLTTGSENVMLGSNAGAVNDGDRNIFIGNSAGWSNTGSNNIIMGYKVGYGYFQTVSNRLIIDNSQVATPLIWGEFDNRRVVINGTNSNNMNNRTFFVNGSTGGTGAWWNDSDERLKKNIKTIESPLKKVLALRGVNYEWKDTTNHDKGLQMGFIAQETIKIIPEVVSNGGETYAMQYAPITALLVEAIKEQQKEIDDLEILNNRIKQLEEQNQKLLIEIELIKELLKTKK